jgi:AcrR family transcriptional regulator
MARLRGERGRRPAGTRERILDVALNLFTAQGYDQTSLREIAEPLGVTKAALYYHFPSKDEILRELMARVLNRFEGIVAAAESAGSAPRRRRVLVEGWVDLLLAERQVLRMVVAEHPQMHENAHLREVHERAHQAMDGLIRGLSGPVSDERGSLRAHFTVAGLLDASFHAPGMAPERLRETLVEVALSALGRGPLAAPGRRRCAPAPE